MEITFNNYDFMVDVLNRNGFDLNWNGKKLITDNETITRKKKVEEFLKSGFETLFGNDLIDVWFTEKEVMCLYRKKDDDSWVTKKTNEDLFEIAKRIVPFDGQYFIYDGKKCIFNTTDCGFVIEKPTYGVQLSNSQKMITLKSLVNMVKNNKINLNHPVQRLSDQWNKDQESDLIDSVFQAIILPPIILSEDSDNIWVLDGKQRLSTLYKFYYEGLKVVLNGEKITYESLPEEYQEFLDNTNINVITYYDSSDEQTSLLFTRLNNGTVLSGDQKLRGIESLDVLSNIKEILSHSFFEKVNFTKGQLKKSEDETVILQTMMILSGFEYKNFSFKEIQRFLKETDKDTILGLKDTIIHNLDILDGFIEERHKNLKKINLPMILSTVKDTEDYKNLVIDFLENYDTKEEYRIHCMGATSQREHVEGRLNYFR
jgi:hypothetical protein